MEMLNGVLGQAAQVATRGVNIGFNQINRFNVGGRLAACAESSFAPLGVAVAAQVMLRGLNHYENSQVSTKNSVSQKTFSSDQTYTALVKQLAATLAGFTLLQLVLKKEGLAGLDASLAKTVVVNTALTIADDRAIQGAFVKEQPGKTGLLYKSVAYGYLAVRLFDLGLHQGVGFNNLLRGDFGLMKASYISTWNSLRALS